jgi:hypothetical protein
LGSVRLNNPVETSRAQMPPETSNAFAKTKWAEVVWRQLLI